MEGCVVVHRDLGASGRPSGLSDRPVPAGRKQGRRMASAAVARRQPEGKELDAVGGWWPPPVDLLGRSDAGAHLSRWQDFSQATRPLWVSRKLGRLVIAGAV